MSTLSLFKSIENTHGVYRGKHYTKLYVKFCESLREHAMKIFNFKKKKKFLNTNAAGIIYENAKICYIRKEKFGNKHLKDKKYRKVRDHCHYTRQYRGAAHSTCNLKYSVPKKIPIVFHNGSNYDYYFIIKELGEEFKRQFTRLGENKCSFNRKRSYKN